jgi:hypothetical protein
MIQLYIPIRQCTLERAIIDAGHAWIDSGREGGPAFVIAPLPFCRILDALNLRSGSHDMRKASFVQPCCHMANNGIYRDRRWNARDLSRTTVDSLHILSESLFK